MIIEFSTANELSKSYYQLSEMFRMDTSIESLTKIAKGLSEFTIFAWDWPLAELKYLRENMFRISSLTKK